ncbi:MAG TPA: cupin domain-containing protein [Verrucomicrobiales bacterium]|nr:cupin domain-containing protein [Verrucomicrobiales bacterium]
MIVRSLSSSEPFRTRDGSLIRSILDRSNAPVENQSLAEACLEAGGATVRHYHRLSEEFYFVLEGEGCMEVDGEQRELAVGDCVLIPPRSWHQIQARTRLRFLCCCAPPYAHEDTYFG